MKTNEAIAIEALVQSIVADLELAAGLATDMREAAEGGEIQRAIGGLVSMRPLAASMVAQIDAALALNVRRRPWCQGDAPHSSGSGLDPRSHEAR